MYVYIFVAAFFITWASGIMANATDTSKSRQDKILIFFACLVLTTLGLIAISFAVN